MPIPVYDASSGQGQDQVRFRYNILAPIRDLPSQESGSHLDSLTPYVCHNDTLLHFVRFFVYVESKEMFKRVHTDKTIDTLNDVKKQTLYCYVNIYGWYDYLRCKLGN